MLEAKGHYKNLSKELSMQKIYNGSQTIIQITIDIVR